MPRHALMFCLSMVSFFVCFSIIFFTYFFSLHFQFVTAFPGGNPPDISQPTQNKENHYSNICKCDFEKLCNKFKQKIGKCGRYSSAAVVTDG